MFNLQELKKEFSNCGCGNKHDLDILDIQIGSGIVKETGKILIKNGFKKNLLLVADKNTLNASDGLLESLNQFNLTKKIYENLLSATVKESREIEKLLTNVDGVISVGTGSINDICRMASAWARKPLCIFATAPSMDGFASYNAPLVDGNFKITYSAKSPEVIIADTSILAKSPSILKGAGFGDMMGKYVGLIDWQVSALITGEYYCEKVANLTRQATDKILQLADRITATDEESAGAVLEALLLTGIGMSFTKTSRPASGTEHILSHFWECKKLVKGQQSDFHGRKVAVATLSILELYEKLAQLKSVKAKKEVVDWLKVYSAYGELKEEVIKLNTPDTITDDINPKIIEENWGKIVEIISSVPSVNDIKKAMIKANCPTTIEEIGVSKELFELGMTYHPFMRRRLSLRRIMNMIEL